MKTDRFLQRASNLFAENRLLKFCFVAMAIAYCFNSLMVFRAVKYQRTILIPPKLTGTIEFVHGRPSESYILDMSRRIINLAATYSPATVRGQLDELLSYYAPESYPEASETWYSLASRVEESLVSSVFYVEKITFNDKIIEIFGNLRQYAGDTSVLDSISRTYLVDYRVNDGRFYIVSIREKIEGTHGKQENRGK